MKKIKLPREAELELSLPDRILIHEHQAPIVRHLDPRQVWEALPARIRDSVALEDFQDILFTIMMMFAEVERRDMSQVYGEHVHRIYFKEEE